MRHLGARKPVEPACSIAMGQWVHRNWLVNTTLFPPLPLPVEPEESRGKGIKRDA